MRRNVILWGAVCLLGWALSTAPAQAKPQWSYAVKFVCGFNPSNVGTSLGGEKQGEPTVKLGNYATDINIYNPDVVVDPDNPDNQLFKYVLVLVARGDQILGREPKRVESTGFDYITLPPGSSTMDDCNRIGELIYGTPPPTPFPLTIGYFVIKSVHELDVTAVYTSELCNSWASDPKTLECLSDSPEKANGVSISQDVEQIVGKKLF
jgi:hypothetical protein